MWYPDPAEKSLYTPQMTLAQRSEHPGAQIKRAPRCILLTWGERLWKRAHRLLSGPCVRGLVAERPLVVGEYRGVRVGLLHPGIGGPATALSVEKLWAAGARDFVGVGFGGILEGALEPGDLLVVKKAARHEGVSGHYGERGVWVESPREGLKKLQSAKAWVGRVWTTDAPYRETRSALHRFRRLGCDLVDMESASFLSVLRFRGLSGGVLLVGSDELTSKGWKGGPRELVLGGARRAVDEALRALTSPPPQDP